MRKLVWVILWLGLFGCGGGDDGRAIRERMDGLYGENRVLTQVPEGAPSVTAENGTFVGRDEDGVLTFKGIPYAQPPVGELRWREPHRVDMSSLVREALYFGKSGIQTLSETARASYYKQGEDCLTLNVWSASCDTASSRPVMVWIHGGSYGWGGTSDPLYDGHNFVKAHPEVVLVTINYRLGLLGFLDLTQLEGGESYTASGNLGLLDQVAALEWIQRNIREFGGDPSRVTVFGCSSGGGSVSLLSLMPQARELFKRIIAQSGSVALSSSREECGRLVEQVKKATGAKSVADLLSLSEQELMKLNDDLDGNNCFPMRDGKLLPLDPYASYAAGAAKDIDMLMGTNRDECRYWIGAMGGVTGFKLALPVWYDNILTELDADERRAVEQFVETRDDERIWNITEFMNELMFRGPMLTMADDHARAGGNTYVYYWAYPSALPGRGACHAVEVAYVLNNTQEHIFTGDNIDPSLAREVQQMWVNFAATGDPSTADHEFPRYDVEKLQCVLLDSVITVESDLLGTQRRLVSPLIAKQISPLYNNMSLNVPTVWRYVAYVVVLLLVVIVGFKILKRGFKKMRVRS